MDFTGLTFSLHGVPMFHAQGISYYSVAVSNYEASCVNRSDLIPLQAVTGAIMAVFPPTDPPIVPNTEKVFEGVVATQTDHIVTAPPFVEVRDFTRIRRL